MAAFERICNRCKEEGLTWLKREGKYRLYELDREATKDPANFDSARPKMMMKMHECVLQPETKG